jgi:hypothetical protein
MDVKTLRTMPDGAGAGPAEERPRRLADREHQIDRDPADLTGDIDDLKAAASREPDSSRTSSANGSSGTAYFVSTRRRRAERSSSSASVSGASLSTASSSPPPGEAGINS